MKLLIYAKTKLISAKLERLRLGTFGAKGRIESSEAIPPESFATFLGCWPCLERSESVRFRLALKPRVTLANHKPF